MAKRETTEPTINERGDERHPSWGVIGASRGSNGRGAALFDSDVRHQHSIRLQISTATRKRDLNRDWIHADQEFVEVEMSEAQWASFVSSMNNGSGVPCTIRRRESEWLVPEAPHEPRLEQSMSEVREAADSAVAKITEAFVAYKEKKSAANLRALESAIENMPANAAFVGKSLSEHAENVVQRARADIEAMVLQRAGQLGLEPGDLGIGTPQLTAATDESGEA